MTEQSMTLDEIDTEYAAALARVREYKEQLQLADRQADRNSLDRARDLELLYQSMRWVDEVPAPKNKIWRGRPVDPRSRNRFAKWVLQTTGLHPAAVGKLHRADEMLQIIGPTGPIIPTSERALRPFTRLRRAGYGERIPDVYKAAVQLAEGRAPTSAETAKAVRDYLAQWSPAQRAARSRAEIANSHRLKAQTAVRIFWNDGDTAQIEQFRQWFKELDSV